MTIDEILHPGGKITIMVGAMGDLVVRTHPGTNPRLVALEKDRAANFLFVRFRPASAKPLVIQH